MPDGLKFLETVEMWDGATPFTIDRVARVLELLGNPQNSISAVHVAGTNGKGTVCTQVAAMLVAAGYCVGQACSPHLSSVTERCLINGRPVDGNLLGAMIDRVRAVAEREGLTLSYFEYVTAASFLVFVQANVDWIVVEVGLGGRLDATNTIASPKVCAITSISFDHMHLLGDTLEKIAAEKAGIIKNNVPVFVGAVDKGPREVITARARECNAPVEFFEQFVLTEQLPGTLKSYQRENALLSVRIAHSLGLPAAAIDKGLRGAYWPGRLEQVSLPLSHVPGRNARCVIDAAHNEAGIKKFLEFLTEEIVPKGNIDKIVFVLSVSKQKEWATMAALLRDFKKTVGAKVSVEWFVTRFNQALAEEPKQLAAELPGSQLYIRSHDALQAAVSHATEHSLIVITGSIYLIGELRPSIVAEGFSTIRYANESQV